MDSRLKRRAIFLTVVSSIAIFTVVAFTNADVIGRRLQSASPASTPETEEGGAEDLESARAAGAAGTKKTAFGTQIGEHLTAFESDPLFFNKELSDAERLLMEQGKEQLSLIVTSVEKDIRVQIVGELGVPKEGVAFFITLRRDEDAAPIGQYKDLDRDGVVYIGDLSPGEYEVSLEPLEDYAAPARGTRIRVKAQVEYYVIDDIGLLIRSEDEIDATVEDTEQKEAAQDADASENSEHRTDRGHFGIDVSKYQKEIDWAAVKAAGVEFAIIRCGYRGSKTGCLVEDPYFERNLSGAKAAGVNVGLYFFTQAISEVEAVEEASMALALCDGLELEYPIYIDTEGAGGNGRADGLETEPRTNVCRAFCATVENAGYRAGVYASRNWWKNNLRAEELDGYEAWLAEYRDIPLYDGYYSLWQYTSKGSVNGIEGRVDLNLGFER